MGKAESQRNLDRWTDQKWRTSDGKPAKRKGGTTRYLPDAAWKKLTPAQKAATNRKKKRVLKRGNSLLKTLLLLKRLLSKREERSNAC